MLNIPEIGQRIKNGLEDVLAEWGVLLLVFLLSLASFGLGRLSALESGRPPVTVSEAQAASVARAMAVGGQVVAARTGKAYYFPWCGGADRIAAQNKVWFSSEQAAKKAGYAPAKNCKGLE